MQTPSTLPAINERSLIWLVGLVQFINILDFMMVMPLGPDFSLSLSIPANHIGEIGGAYTFAAAISGLVTALFLDKYPRKPALIVCLCGLIIATLCGAFVWDSGSMIVARLLAGAFGGPLSALALALIADYIPPERRGQALGKVMGSHSVASVLGVPFGLELARHFSWRAPFVVTALLGVAVAVFAWRRLPFHRPFQHTGTLRQRLLELLLILRSRLALMTYAMMALSMLAGFIIIPNISAHVQLNLGYPRDWLGLLYFCGGCVSFFGMRIAGRMVDRYSSLRVMSIFTAMLIVSIACWFVWFPPMVVVLPMFVLFMVSTTGRMVSAQAISSKIPAPAQRGSYMALQSAVMHFSSAFGAYISALILVEDGGRLLHVPVIGGIAIICSAAVPFLCWRVEKQIRQKRAS